MRSFHLLAVGVIIALGLLIPLGVGARSPGTTIFLRRASFDPLQAVPAAVAAVDAADGSTLRLAQLDGPPTAARIAALKEAGLDPLIYIPDNTFLVRSVAGGAPQLAGLRWLGTLPSDYKLAPELVDLSVADTSLRDLRVLATPDADTQVVAAAISAAGGSVSGSYTTLNGASITARLPGAALASMAARDDVLWIEPRMVPKLLNNTTRALIGVDAARQELGWLTGDGQIVAVTDTGLDRSDSLSADFSGRIAATFTPQQMDGSCTTTDWSDHDGHGTHVSGSILGSGALSPAGTSFAGMAPQARLVVQAVASSTAAGSLDCLPTDSSFLQKAYDAGARVQNASWGSPTGQSSSPPFGETYGGYDDFAALVDDFLYRHPTHLLVVAAGNSGSDANRDGVIDADSIGSPATAKNVLAVGATENRRPPTTSSCAIADPENRCWSSYVRSGSPITSDFVSDNPSGMAAFSSRGPTDDGRIKPDIVAPGSNVISSGSHASNASYDDIYDANYAYESGTSMSTPMVSGAAVLVRQWLSQARGLSEPSAALVRALLLNGATNLSPGQYGTGSAQEIPSAWPNSVQGWGRVNLSEAVQLSDAQIWLRDETSGLNSGASVDYPLVVTSSSPRLRVTLTWTDYPASPLASKTLVNDLDLELIAPDGSIVRGNSTASLSSACQAQGADRCNTSESVEVAAAQLGTYTLRVTGASVVTNFQAFAIVARTSGGSVTTPPTVYDQHAYLPLVGR